MPISDIDRQLLLVQAVGDVDPVTGDPVLPTAQGSTGIVFSNIGRLWLKYADKALISPALRDLYVQRDACDIVIGRLSSLVDISTNNGQISIKLSQRVAAYFKQRELIDTDIIAVESKIAKASGPAIAAIARTAPIIPPVPGERSSPYVYGPDANDPRISGSPYWPSPRRRS